MSLTIPAAPVTATIPTVCRPGPLSVTRLKTVTDALDRLVVSPDAQLVFTSLARLCVPVISDRCVIVVAEDGRDPYQLVSPPDHAVDKLTASAHTGGAGHTLPLDFDLPARTGWGATRGVVTFEWQQRRPTAADVAYGQLATDRATTVLDRLRLLEDVVQAETVAADLRTALQSNRQIGAAIGIIMAGFRITEDEAFATLRDISPRSHIKLRDIAEEVTRTGCLS